MGNDDTCDASFGSDRRRRRVVLIEPSKVKVPRANTDIATIDKTASAMMFDRKRLTTYSWK